MPETIITSRRHALVSRCRDAAGGHADDVLLEGPHLIADAIAAGVHLRLVIVAEGAEARAEIGDLIAWAEFRGHHIQRVTPAVLDAASPTRTPVGVLALATLTLHDVPRLVAPEPALVTVAVGVQDPGNLGTIVRSCEAAGGTGVLATGGTAHPFGWKALRGSMGSALRLPVARVGDPTAALTSLRAQGLRLVALSAESTLALHETDLRGPIALIAGAEGAGLPTAILDAADLRVRIPMQPPVESLNVGVAASLVLFEVARQRALHGPSGSASLPMAGAR